MVAPRLGVRTLAYGLIGGELKLGMFGAFEAELDQDEGWSCTLDAGARAELSGASISMPKLFGFLSFNYEPSLNDELVLWRYRGLCGEPEIEVKYHDGQTAVEGRNQNTKCSWTLDEPGVNEFKLNARWLKPRTRYDLILRAGPPLEDIKLDPVTSDAFGFIDVETVKIKDMPGGVWELIAKPEKGPEAKTTLLVGITACLYYNYTPDGEITFESLDGFGTYPNTLVTVTAGTGTGQGTSDDNGTYLFPVTGHARCGDTIQVTRHATYRFRYQPTPQPLTLPCNFGPTATGQGARGVALPLPSTG